MENMWRMVTVKLLHACTTHMIVASSIDILRCKQALTSIPCEVLVIKILFSFIAVLASGSFSIQCYLGSYKSISLLSTGNVNICCCRCDKQGSSLCLGSTEPCHLLPAYAIRRAEQVICISKTFSPHPPYAYLLVNISKKVKTYVHVYSTVVHL